jgi:hypothetical protein
VLSCLATFPAAVGIQSAVPNAGEQESQRLLDAFAAAPEADKGILDNVFGVGLA